jgi:large conductance mechanosensitive channel
VGKLLKGFRDFILRGNIVDLAVGVVVGVAFNDLVTKMTGDFIQPLINLAGGGGIRSGQFHVRGQSFNWSDFVNALIHFLIVAAVVYFFVVRPMNMIMARMRRGEEKLPPAPPTDETKLLTEIRDLLARQTGQAAVPAGAPIAPEPRSGESGTPDTGTA